MTQDGVGGEQIDIIGGLVPNQPRRWRRRGGGLVTIMLIGLAALLGAGYFAAYVYLGDRVPRGTTMRGVDIGGLTASQAEQRLEAQLAPKAQPPISVLVNDQSAQIDPAVAGMRFDIPASVVAAGGSRSLNPARMLKFVVGGDEVAPVVDVDTEAMNAALTTLAGQVDRPPSDGAIAFKKGRAVVTEPVPGVSLNKAAAAQKLRDRFLTGQSLDLPFDDQPANVTSEAVQRALDTFVTPATSGPVTLRLGDHPVKAKPRDYLKAITMVPDGRELVPSLDAAKLTTALKPAMRTVGKTPKDARFEVVDGKPRLIPARVGVAFDDADLEAGFLDTVVKPAGQRTLQVKAATAQPEFTTAEAKALGIKRRVSTFTTYFPYAEYRNINLPRAAELINGTLLKPGETFSLNGIVGERTAENGFTKGYVIKNGLFKEDFGGGVSQIATTTFNAMFFAGLEDVEHKPHSVYIDRYPVGREATVAWGALDLKFKNTTPYGILIEAKVTKSTPSSSGVATVSMYSTKYWDITTSVGPRTNPTAPGTVTLKGPDCEPASGLSGFTVDVWRYFRRHGSTALTRSEKFHTVYKPSARVICKK